MNRTRILFVLFIAAALTLAGFAAVRAYEDLRPPDSSPVPVTSVKRGDVVISVSAHGHLQGGNSKMLTAPMTGSPQLILTELIKTGEPVREGDVVARFDTTEETFKLREAEADLLEAEQQVLQSRSESQALEEELDYELIKARADLKLAELECRRNELLPAIVAKQNDLALLAARERLDKLEHDYPERKTAAKASIAIQDAAQQKAQVLANTAKRNIDMMTLKAPATGYASVERNTNSNFFFPGMLFPMLQVGDMVRPGMGVVQIPDLTSWEVIAQISEEDRGHLAIGQPAEMSLVALGGRKFQGKVSSLGGTTGPPWNRRFECKLALHDPTAELRPGMSARLVIHTQSLKDTLWIPAQGLFERDGKKFVYLRGDGGFAAKDVELIRRSESRVAIKGINEGDLVALANPTSRGESKKASKSGAGPMGAITK